MSLISHSSVVLVFAFLATLNVHASPISIVAGQYPIELALLRPPLALNWTTSPDPSSTYHLIFESAAGLFQHWSNTVYPYGHSLVPSVIPLGTIMYHGRGQKDADVPTIPDWLSFDAEHAMLFAKGKNATLLTFTPKRPLNVLYFDGNSGGNDIEGRFDTQYLLDKGEIVYEGWDIIEDFERAVRLCEWAERFQIDGFIRMEFDFEAIICDFPNTLTLTSSLHVLPRPGFNHTTPTPPPGETPKLAAFAPIMALVAERYNHYPGLPYITPDYSRLITLFDPILAPSLLHLRQNKTRREYRLLGMPKAEAMSVKARLEEVLLDDSERSGIHWELVLRAVKNSYVERLSRLKRTLASFSGHNDVARTVMRQLSLILAPFIGLNDIPAGYLSQSSHSDSHAGLEYDWAVPVFERCASSLTADLSESRMTREEVVLLHAVEGVMREICRIMVKGWASLIISQRAEAATDSIDVLGHVKDDMDSLVDWLGWPEWRGCAGGCDDDHFCWQPEWMPIWEDIEETEPYCFEREPAIMDRPWLS